MIHKLIKKIRLVRERILHTSVPVPNNSDQLEHDAKRWFLVTLENDLLMSQVVDVSHYCFAQLSSAHFVSAA